MKKTIISFIIWYFIAFIIGYFFYGREIFTLRFGIFTFIILGSNFLIFNPKNMKKITELVNPQKNKNE